MTDQDAGEATPTPARPHPIYNWLSFFGFAVFAASASTFLFFASVDLLTSDESAYGGLMLLPPFSGILLGLFLVAVGWLRERSRQKRGLHSSFLDERIVVPLAFVRRFGIISVVVGLMIGTAALLTVGAGSLAAVEYTESNHFCGEVCHAVMSPEATVYATSPHAQIPCVECHVGEGGDSYLRAKIGGMRQVWAVATDTVARPIPTPVHNLPSSEKMCEGCHTRERFIGYTALSRRYHVSGSEEDPVNLLLMVKVGGGASSGPIPGNGIHYHMLGSRKVEYIARDEQHQDIAWVRVTEADGATRVFESEESPLDEEERMSATAREMECVDCHNRPAHRFKSPVQSVSEALAIGTLPADLSRIKEAGVRALDGGYETTEAAMTGIDESIRAFYEEESPEVLEESPEQIDQSVDTLRAIYSRTIFPEMKADWSAHPDNIGHLDSAGCFRCHNEDMVDEDGEAVVTDCNACHAIVAQTGTTLADGSDYENGQPFVHPEDFGTLDEFTQCNECHTGGAALYE